MIADGVERWKDADVAVVADAMKGMDAETLTVAFFGREEGRHKIPAALRKAVEAAGGQIAEEGNVKPRELPRWLIARAAELGIELDQQARAGARSRMSATASSGCCASSRSSRSSTVHGARLGRRRGRPVLGQLGRAQDVDARRRARGRRRADRDARAARAARSRASACPGCCTGWCAACATRSRSRRRSRQGSRPHRSRRACGCRRSAAARLVADVGKRDVEAFRRALELMADLELESRGGGGGVLSEDTAAVRAVIGAAR